MPSQQSIMPQTLGSTQSSLGIPPNCQGISLHSIWKFEMGLWPMIQTQRGPVHVQLWGAQLPTCPRPLIVEWAPPGASPPCAPASIQQMEILYFKPEFLATYPHQIYTKEGTLSNICINPHAQAKPRVSFYSHQLFSMSTWIKPLMYHMCNLCISPSPDTAMAY